MSPEVLVPAEYPGDPQKGIRTENIVGPRAEGLGLALRSALVLVPFLALSPQPSALEGGTVKGRTTFTGKEPCNRVIRMGVDPMCASANAGKRPVDEVFLVGDHDTLGNVFVKL